MTPRRTLVLVFFLALLTSFAVTATDHIWGNYHWVRKIASFTLKTIDSMTSEWGGALDGSISRWSTRSSVKLMSDSH